jgi:signal transduction histidine kinase
LIVGFLSYRRIKTFEQASIWGGLAKETAHQLGTPISSLMGWVELSAELNKQKGDETTAEVYANMQSDLARLQSITERFGKIGSYPQKTRININSVIGDVVAYFQKRLPNRSKQVEIRVVSHELPEILANADLLQWVFENLIRNSLDAMDKDTGCIEIDARFDQKKYQIAILYKDDGKGIARKDRNKIFQPGMTTKRHGWGLGLTLVKRIIEAYHHGRIRLVETGPQGTTFEIVLPVETVMAG